MTNYREILRLRSLGINNKQIAESMGIARQTVVTVLQRTFAQGLDWQAAEFLSDSELSVRLFPQEGGRSMY
jgi:orotate phosphoribosyltransferase-like protein